jgi:hypothetical protein
VCPSGYCYEGNCYTPPPPTPTSCTAGADAITNGGFDTWGFAPWTESGASIDAEISGDEGNGPDAMMISASWPVTLSQDIVICPGTQYTFTMASYSYSGGCSVAVSLNGEQILSQGVTVREHDADPLGPVGPGTIYIDPNDGNFTPWGVSRNATITISFSCGGYATVYADEISFYGNS